MKADIIGDIIITGLTLGINRIIETRAANYNYIAKAFTEDYAIINNVLIFKSNFL